MPVQNHLETEMCVKPSEKEIGLRVYSRKKNFQRKEDTNVQQCHESNPRDILSSKSPGKTPSIPLVLESDKFDMYLKIPIAHKKVLAHALNIPCLDLCPMIYYHPFFMLSPYNFLVSKFLEVCKML